MKYILKINLFVLFILLFYCIVMFSDIKMIVFAEEYENEYDNIEFINNGIALNEEMNEKGMVYYSIENYALENNSGFGCGSTCGASREEGYSLNYQKGCRNWQVMPFMTPTYKYWIDESTLESLTESQREIFIRYVDKAAEEWSSVRISDYTGQIVKLEKKDSNGIRCCASKI